MNWNNKDIGLTSSGSPTFLSRFFLTTAKDVPMSMSICIALVNSDVEKEGTENSSEDKRKKNEQSNFQLSDYLTD